MSDSIIDGAMMRMRQQAGTPPVTLLATRVRLIRLVAIAALVFLPCLWHVRTTRAVQLPALSLLAATVVACVVFGAVLARWTHAVVPRSPGIAYEFLLGFLAGNTLLFGLTIVSPLGFGWHLTILGALAIACALLPRSAGATNGPRRSQDHEWASLAAILLSGLFATLWTVDQQPIEAIEHGQVVFKVWYDVFIHVREISAFAQSHGLSSLSDIKLAGIPAPVYHFASYMIPAALNALAGTSAMDAYAAFQLPFGLLLTGLAAYALTAVAFRATWQAVVAVAVMALPDAYQQGFGLHYLSYHYMSQVNLGMLYGIACIAVAWLFMIESCRRGRVTGLILSYVLLAVCIGYKAHLFVANAALLLLYPCLFFGRFKWTWRVLAGCVLAAVFVSAVVVSQSSPRVPTMRLDGSGLSGYIDLLMGGFSRGRFRALFESLYYATPHPRIVGVLLSGGLILLTSFGVGLVVVPAVLWWQRRAIDVRVLAFIALVFVNYLVMSMGLALDDRSVGTPEEILNRPHAWAYFVVVTAGLGAFAIGAWGRDRMPSRRALGVMAITFGTLVAFVHLKSANFQTIPEWDAYARYDEFNAVPECLVRSARYVRDHARVDELMQDSRLDDRLIVTSLAERQAFVSTAVFGGRTEVAAERVATFRSAMATLDARSLDAWLRAHRVHWFVLHPEDAVGRESGFLDQAVFGCDGYRVFKSGR